MSDKTWHLNYNVKLPDMLGKVFYAPRGAVVVVAQTTPTPKSTRLDLVMAPQEYLDVLNG